jgi:hypothetical protein
MKSFWQSQRALTVCLIAATGTLAGCSGSTEDVRVSLCKNLSTALQPSAQSIEFTGGENTFNRPSYAVTGLTFDVVDSDGKRTSMRSACHYAYEALDDTALTLADPLSAYATLPFKMTLNGRELSKVELRDLVNAEQRRLGKKAIDTVKQGARDAVDKVKSAAGGN